MHNRRLIALKNYLEGINTERLAFLAKEQRSLTYIELCREIGMTPVTSNSKTAQLKQLSQICRYEKEKTHYRLLEYYANPIIIEDRKQKYQPYIKAIILGSLSEGKSIVVTASELREWLVLCNRNFKFLGSRANRTKIALKSQFDINALNKMYFQSLQFFSQTIENCFRSLKKHKLITLENGYRLFNEHSRVKTATSVFAGNPHYSKVSEVEQSVFEALKAEGKIHPARNGFIASRSEQEMYWKECSKSVCEELSILSYNSVKRITLCVEKQPSNVEEAKKILNAAVTEKLSGALCRENLNAEFIHNFIQTAESSYPNYLDVIENADADYIVAGDNFFSEFQKIILNRTN